MKKIVLILLFIQTAFVYSQVALKSTEEEYYDFLSLQGLTERPTLGYRTLSDSVWEISEDCEHVWQNNNLGSTKILWQSENQGENWFTKGFFHGFKYKLFGPDWFNSYNTASPYGQNDGALWQGRGYNSSLTAGARIEGYGFEITFKPMVTFSQNLEFEINNDIFKNPYSYSFYSNNVVHLIDYVQRYGDKSFFDFSFGDSEIRWNWNTFTIGFGTQTPWLGPAQLNPMLGSNNATPYLKFDMGLKRTSIIIPKININIGDIEGRIWIGKLKESNYFDTIETNNDRMLISMTASYKPSFIPGLTFGLNRIFLTNWKNENLNYLLRLFTLSRGNATNTGNDEDQKFSIFVTWQFPAIGFEVYGEFGRDDFSNDENTNPFHTAIYTIGIKQIIPLSKRIKSELMFEWNNFEMSQDFQLQWTYMGYYAHGFINQGYTNNGQILGAGSGAFGNSQYLKYKVYLPSGSIGIYYHRFCPNNNSIYSQAVNTIASEVNNEWYANFETYSCLGLQFEQILFQNLFLSEELSYVCIMKRNYEKRTVNNFYITVNIKYQF